MPDHPDPPRIASAATEPAGGSGLSEAAAEEWLTRNCAALDAYNDHVEKHGVFSDGLRSF